MIKYDKTFKEEWSTPVPLCSVIGESYGASMSMLTNDKLYMVYNDNEKNNGNLDPREIKKLMMLSQAVSVLVSIDLKTGSLTKQPLFDTGSIESILMPPKCLQSGPNEMILFARKKANVNFGRLTLE